MAPRKFTSLLPDERKEVIDGILAKLEPQIEASINQYLQTMEPKMRQIVRDEIGRWAVSEKQASAFIDGMIRDAAEKSAAYFRPSWLARIFFRGRIS